MFVTKVLPYFPLLFWALFAVPAQAGLYRWVDEQGEVHYSDVVPQSATKQERSELNEQGMTIKTFPAAPTAEEIAARERQETLAKLRNALDNKQQEQDNYLLANYADVTELDAVFNSKLAVLDKNTRSITERRDTLANRVDAVKAQAAKLDSVDERDTLQAYVHEAEQTLASYDYAIQENQTEQDRLRQHYEKDRARLSVLLSGSPSSQRPDPSKAPATLRVALDHQ
ncbi:MAG: DUF4124 domain-containing protein [Candidatus Thiothrix singaporensis]|uniref:DUF4124 domain-containing protein n=1 Tax=Candidatus Thiothrix singaporensis TaxID=2799669 RepID=A0A7L6AQD2_9GAMM|nr:MAG: DUF4124 domain-containing protein [Candidatus Thiothrix singaporensis]